MSQDLLTLPHPNVVTAIEEDRLMLCHTQPRSTQNKNRCCQKAIALLDETLSAMIHNHKLESRCGA